jgi:hypothetical protein
VDLTEGSEEWREALDRAVQLVQARAADVDYSGKLGDSLRYAYDGGAREAALFTDALVAVAYQLTLTLDQAIKEGGVAVPLETILDEVRNKLSMHSGLAQIEAGDFDGLFDGD